MQTSTKYLHSINGRWATGPTAHTEAGSASSSLVLSCLLRAERKRGGKVEGEHRGEGQVEPSHTVSLGVALKPRFLKQATGLGVVITYQSVDCECRREHEFQNTHSQVMLSTYLFYLTQVKPGNCWVRNVIMT